MKTKARYVGTDKGRNTFHFRCECGADGMLSLKLGNSNPFPCPEDCGRVYVQWRDHRNVPTLTCVVCPVSVPADAG